MYSMVNGISQQTVGGLHCEIYCNYHSVFFRLLGVRILTDTYVSLSIKKGNNYG